MPKILIADDHLIVLVGTQHILEEQFPGAEVHTVENFDDALTEIKKGRFDLIILDINLPGGNRLAMIESLRLRQPDIKILMFSAFEEAQYAGPYMKAGADGYISKRADREELHKAVMSLLQNKRYLSAEMQQVYIERMLSDQDPFSRTLDKLSQKEIEIMYLLAAGMSTNEIASKLAVSAPAISSYKSKIFEKLSVRNIVELKDLITNIRQ